MIRETFAKLLNKQVTRREFLGHAGVLFLSLIGVASLLRSITEITTNHADPKRSLHSDSNSYGSNSYGG